MRSQYESRLVVPWSGIKGAIAHRVAYHYNRIERRFATPKTSAEQLAEWAENNPAVIELFGQVKDDGNGRAGRVIGHDLHLVEQPISIMPHNSIDRFTQGVRDGLLFSEELVSGNSDPMTLSLVILDAAQADARALTALDRALEDLVHGRLALGGGRSHGYCSGRIVRPQQAGGAAREGPAA